MYVGTNKITQSMVILQDNAGIADKWFIGQHAEMSPQCEEVWDKVGDETRAVTTTTVKFRRTVDRAWVLMLGFLHLH